MEKLTMTVAEVAQAVGCHHLTIRAAIARGEIRAVRIGRRVLIPKAELERLLAGEPTVARGPAS